MHIFDENEENKLEYTSVFESYVLIMDDLIDMKLNSKFGQAAVKDFQRDLAANLPKYSTIDAGAVETLQNFLDFDQFKTHMLRVKASTTNKKHAESIGMADDAFLDKLEAENNEDESSGWQKQV